MWLASNPNAEDDIKTGSSDIVESIVSGIQDFVHMECSLITFLQGLYGQKESKN
jgi:hypothetical protein